MKTNENAYVEEKLLTKMYICDRGLDRFIYTQRTYPSLKTFKHFVLFYLSSYLSKVTK